MGYEPRASVLERQFNLRYQGEPVTYHGVRRWLQGETLPTADKLQLLAGWRAGWGWVLIPLWRRCREGPRKLKAATVSVMRTMRCFRPTCV